LCQEEFEDTKG